jgi:hypothetical protein
MTKRGRKEGSGRGGGDRGRKEGSCSGGGRKGVIEGEEGRELDARKVRGRGCEGE